MRLIQPLIVSAVLLAISSQQPAFGFVLSNSDLTVYLTELVEDKDINKVHKIELHQGDAIRNLCAKGCFVRFNGAEYKFSGGEQLTIRNGELVDISN